MLGRGIKITKKMALVMSEDPHVNDFQTPSPEKINFAQMKARRRNKRG
jgi:hypothetical protein